MKNILKKKINTWLGFVILFVFTFGITTVIAAPGDLVFPIIHPGAAEQKVDFFKIGDLGSTGSEFQLTSSTNDKIADFDGQPNSVFWNFYNGYFDGQLNIGSSLAGNTSWASGTSSFGLSIPNTIQTVNVDGDVLSAPLANPTGADPVCVDAYGRLILCGASAYTWATTPWGICAASGGTCSGSYPGVTPSNYCTGQFFASSGYCSGTYQNFGTLTKIDWTGTNFSWNRPLLDSVTNPSNSSTQAEEFHIGSSLALGPLSVFALWANAQVWATTGIPLPWQSLTYPEKSNQLLFLSDTTDNLSFWKNPHTKCDGRRLYFVDENNEWSYYKYIYNYALGCSLDLGTSPNPVSKINHAIVRTGKSALKGNPSTYSCSSFATTQAGCDNLVPAACVWVSGVLSNCTGGTQAACTGLSSSCSWVQYSSTKTCKNLGTSGSCSAQNAACSWTAGSIDSARDVFCTDSAGNAVNDMFCDPSTKPTQTGGCAERCALGVSDSGCAAAGNTGGTLNG